MKKINSFLVLFILGIISGLYGVTFELTDASDTGDYQNCNGTYEFSPSNSPQNGKNVYKHTSQTYYIWHDLYISPAWVIDIDLVTAHAGYFYNSTDNTPPEGSYGRDYAVGANPVLTQTSSAASMAFTNGSGFTPDVTPGSANQALGRFQMYGDVAGANLTAASIRLDGVRTGLSNIKLWSSTNATFESGSDTQLGSTVAADPGNGGVASFSGFTSAIGTSNVYYFITSDVAPGAGGIVQGVLVNNASLTLNNGALVGTISNAALSNGDASLPVELVSFSARHKGNRIILEWTTASEIDNLGFIIERKSENTQWQQIASYLQNEQLTGQGTTQSSTQYRFNDATATKGTYTYRLSEVNTSGQVTVLSTTSVEMAVTPTSTQLFAAYPNPFNPQTTLKYQLEKDAHVTLAVFDVLGRQIKLLTSQQQAAGEYTATWDGTTNAGLAAPSGTYLVRLQSGAFSNIQKIMYIK